MTDSRDRKPPLPSYPLSGPVQEDFDEVTGRYSALGDHPQLQAAFLRMARAREEDRKYLDARLDTLSSEMRARDHAIKNDLAKAIETAKEELDAHALLHVELVGRDGKRGRLGDLEEKAGRLKAEIVGLSASLTAESGKRRDDVLELRADLARVAAPVDDLASLKKSVSSKLRAVAIAAILSLGAAFGAVYSAGIKQGAGAAEAERLGETVRTQGQILTGLQAAMWRAGLIPFPLPASPAPPPEKVP